MHKELLQKISLGQIEDFSEIPKIIETTISHVFIFQKLGKVLKVYKRDNEYWNTTFYDLSGGRLRIDFVKEDFEWNKFFNPEIYVEIFEYNGTNLLENWNNLENDELIISMNLVGTDNFIIPLLDKHKIPTGDYFKIGKLFTQRKINFDKPILDTKWSVLLENRRDDLIPWMKTIPVFSKEDMETVYRIMNDYIVAHRDRLDQIPLVPLIDAHGENIMYDGRNISSIDIFLPIIRWRSGAKDFDLIRLGADILTIEGAHAYEEYIKGVESVTILDRTDEKLYLLESVVMMVCLEETLAVTKPERKAVAAKYYLKMKELFTQFQ